MAESYGITAVFSLKDELSAPLNKISRNMQDISEQPHKITAGLGDMLKGAGVFTVVSKGVDTLKDSIGSAVSRFDTLNQYPKIMKQMGYSTADAKQSVEVLKTSIDGLPTSLDEITKSAQKFAILTGNATKGAKTASALNDAFLASGASASDASRGVEQYSQMLASGKVDMQSWKTLTETMPYSLQEVAKSFGLTGDSAQNDLYNKLQKGQITMKELNDRFIQLDGGATGFANTARLATGGIGTSFTIMKTAVVRGLADMITALDNGVKQAGVKGGIAGLFIQAKGAVDEAFKVINKAIESMTPVVIKVIGYAVDTFNFLKPAIDAVLPVIGVMGGTFLTASTGLWAFNKATGAVSDGLTLIYKHPVVFAILAIGTALVAAYQHSKEFRDFVNKMVKSLDDFSKHVSKSKEDMELLKFSLMALGSAGVIGVVVQGFLKFKKALKDIKSTGDVSEPLKKTGKGAEEGSKGTSKMSTSILKIATGVAIIALSLSAFILSIAQLAKTGNAGAITMIAVSVGLSILIAALALAAPYLDVASIGIAALAGMFLAMGASVLMASVGIALVVTALGKLIEILNNSSQAGENIKNIMQSIGEGFALMILSFVSTMVTNAPIIVNEFVNMILDMLNTMTQRVPDIIASAVTFIITFAQALLDNAFRLIDASIQLIQQLLTGIADRIPMIVESAVQVVLAFVRGIGEAIGYLAGSGPMLLNALVDGIVSGFGKANNAGSGAGKSVFNGIMGIDLGKAGRAIINGFIDGMKSAWEAGKKFVGGIAKWIKEHKGPISYDARLLIPAGNAIMDGLNQGLNDSFKDVQSNVAGMADDLQTNFSGQLSANTTSSSSNYSSVELNANGSTNGLLQELVRAVKNGQVISIDSQKLIGATANGYDGALGNIMTDRSRNQL